MKVRINRGEHRFLVRVKVSPQKCGAGEGTDATSRRAVFLFSNGSGRAASLAWWQ